MQAFDLGIFPWHGHVELSFATQKEVQVEGKEFLRSAGDWNRYCFDRLAEQTQLPMYRASMFSYGPQLAAIRSKTRSLDSHIAVPRLEASGSIRQKKRTIRRIAKPKMRNTQSSLIIDLQRICTR